MLNLDIESQSWVEELLDREIGDTKIIKNTDLSFIKKITSMNRSLYFKAIGPSAKFEPRLTEELFQRHPDKIVEVVASHPSHPWFFMKELQGTLLRETKDKSVWKKALQEYADLQVQETKQVATLLAAGTPDRRFPKLIIEIQENLLAMCETGLSQEETEQIMALESEIIHMCKQMNGVVPYSIDHGDLHSGNIHVWENEVMFFDWGDAAVTHPFFSTRVFWHALDDLIESAAEWFDMVNEFRPYYLEPWTTFAPMKKLEQISHISDQLSCVYRALGWHLYINPYRSEKNDSFKKPAQWLQLLLEHRELVK